MLPVIFDPVVVLIPDLERITKSLAVPRVTGEMSKENTVETMRKSNVERSVSIFSSMENGAHIYTKSSIDGDA
jgi:hypothetical protein